MFRPAQRISPFRIRGTIAYQSYVSRSQLVWVDRAGNQLATIGPAKINVKSARLSPDGQRLATAIYDIETRRAGPLDLRCQNELGTAIDSGARPAGCACLVAGFDEAGVPAHSRRDAAPGPFARPGTEGYGRSDASRRFPNADRLVSRWALRSFREYRIPPVGERTQSDVWVLDLARGRKLVPLLNDPIPRGQSRLLTRREMAGVHFERVRPRRSLPAGVSVGRRAELDWRTLPCFERRRSSGEVATGWEGAVLSRL